MNGHADLRLGDTPGAEVSLERHAKCDGRSDRGLSGGFLEADGGSLGETGRDWHLGDWATSLRRPCLIRPSKAAVEKV